MSHLFCALFAFTAISSYADHKLYVPPEKVRCTENGIFIQTGQSVPPLDSISYDYETEQHHLSAALMRCRACGHNTQDTVKRICYNDECGLYPW